MENAMIEVTQRDIDMSNDMLSSDFWDSPIGCTLSRHYGLGLDVIASSDRGVEFMRVIHRRESAFLSSDKALLRENGIPFRYVVVVNGGIYRDGLPYLIPLPDEAGFLLDDFRRGQPVRPIRFEVKPVYHGAEFTRSLMSWVRSMTSDLLWRRANIGDIHRVESAVVCAACGVPDANNSVELLRQGWGRIDKQEVKVCDYVVDALLDAAENAAPMSYWRPSRNALYANAFA